VTKNPGEHLRSKKHGVKITDPDYKELVKSFKRYEPSHLADIEISESPKKRYGIIDKKKSTNTSIPSVLPTILEEEKDNDIDYNSDYDPDILRMLILLKKVKITNWDLKWRS